MQLLLEELSQVLAEEYRHYERLFTLSQEEQRLLVASDAGSLDRALVEMRAVASRVEELAERRAGILCKISEQTGIPAEQLTMERLSQMSLGVAAVRLDRLRTEFRDMMGRLHTLNGQNLLLIRNSLDMTDRAVRLILGETGQVQFYGEAGKAESAGGPRIVSRRI
ncbi:MAG: flagellar protein FlgN [Candidatus Eisenbacteria bacterium]|nr:flagellar protein FlgN [Candidatus Eisenbacteria bacterium]